MRHFRTEAIIIYRRNFAEADRFLTLFSKEHGKIQALARGVRKITSKSGGKLELLNRVELELYSGSSGINTITDVKSINPFLSLKEQNEALSQVLEISRMISQLLPENEVFLPLYNDFVRFLEVLSENKGKNAEIMAYAMNIRLFTALHELQMLNCCMYCQTKCQEDISYIFDFEHRGFVCSSCLSSHPVDHSTPISFDVIKLFSFLQRGNLSDVVKIRAEKSQTELLDKIKKTV